MTTNDGIDTLCDWLANAGLRGEPETSLVSGFCERAVAAGLPISRAMVLIDTLHPIYEGRLVRWGHDPSKPPVQEYGRTAMPEGLVHLNTSAEQPSEALSSWRESPFFYMLQIGADTLRRRLTVENDAEFSILHDYRTVGLTDYIAVVSRFAPESAIGEMDAVYSSWATDRAGGFDDQQIAVLTRIIPALALAFKAAALTRMIGTLMETYLGRDAGRRVLNGHIMRGVADRIDAVVWFSDLRGFTHITDSAPEQIIPFLNDYADVIVSAIHAHGGDVLKLIGDGILAIFTGSDRAHSCAAALAAATDMRNGVVAVNQRRARDSLPVTDVYLGLHVGKVYYGNVGSAERLDFTVVGPAVNEASRIATMCRSIEQPILVSQSFANVDGIRSRLVSVGRYALRGIAEPQELFTLDSRSR